MREFRTTWGVGDGYAIELPDCYFSPSTQQEREEEFEDAVEFLGLQHFIDLHGERHILAVIGKNAWNEIKEKYEEKQNV